MPSKTYSFRNEDGELVKFTVKEYLTINKNDYVLMCPENDPSDIEVYKFGKDMLELVENDQELQTVKSTSKVI